MSEWFWEGEVRLAAGVDLEKVLRTGERNDISY